MSKFCLVLLLTILVSGCSRNEVILESVSDGYQVEVSSDGRPVSDFQQRLVHRVDIKQVVANKMQANLKQRKTLPFKARIEKDLAGTISGARILPPNSRGLEILGLKSQDLLTAVDKTQIRSIKDVSLLFDQLAHSGQVTMTILRQGKAHKMLYLVTN